MFSSELLACSIEIVFANCSHLFSLHRLLIELLSWINTRISHVSS